MRPADLLWIVPEDPAHRAQDLERPDLFDPGRIEVLVTITPGQEDPNVTDIVARVYGRNFEVRRAAARIDLDDEPTRSALDHARAFREHAP